MSRSHTRDDIVAAARAHYAADHPDWPEAAAAFDDMGGAEPSTERAHAEHLMEAALAVAAPQIAARALRQAAELLDATNGARVPEGIDVLDFDVPADLGLAIAAHKLRAIATELHPEEPR